MKMKCHPRSAISFFFALIFFFNYPSSCSERKELFLDTAHSALNTTLYGITEWLDSFFADETYQDDYRADYLLIVTQQLQLRETSRARNKSLFHADIKLPNTMNKLRLIFEGENETSDLREDTGSNFSDWFADNLENSDYAAGLRISFLNNSFSELRMDTGLKNSLKEIESILRVRYSIKIHLTQRNIFSLYNTVLWEGQKIPKKDFSTDITSYLTSKLDFTVKNRFYYYNFNKDYNFTSTFKLRQKLSDKTALAYLYSYSRIKESFIENKLVFSISLKNQFFRKWLFFTIRPQYNRSDRNASFKSVYLMLDIYFSSLRSLNF